ncbi:MAG: ABC transporter permease subunit [Oscillospiraceae bacterium]|nr:ABC transporter permease subunit [Oscillospiraceae bacterium]
MGRLIRYELKKLLPVRRALVCLLALTAVCAGLFAYSCAQADYREMQEALTAYTGSANTGALAQAQRRYEQLLPKQEAGALTQAEQEEWEALEFPVWLNRCDSVRKSSLAEMGLQARTLAIGETVAYGLLEDFIASYLPAIAIFLIAFFVSPVFSSEYENRTDALLLAARHGKRRAILAKMAAALLLTTFVYAAAVGIYAALSLAVWGPGDGNASFVMTAVDVFRYLSSPFEFRVWQYVPVLLLVSWLGCLGFCMFTLLVSALNRRALWATMVSLAAGLIPFVAYHLLSDESAPLTNVLRFAYSQAISVRTLFSGGYTVSLFGAEIRTVYLSLPALAGVSAIFGLLACQVFRRHQVSNE